MPQSQQLYWIHKDMLLKPFSWLTYVQVIFYFYILIVNFLNKFWKKDYLYSRLGWWGRWHLLFCCVKYCWTRTLQCTGNVAGMASAQKYCSAAQVLYSSSTHIIWFNIFSLQIKVDGTEKTVVNTGQLIGAVNTLYDLVSENANTLLLPVPQFQRSITGQTYEVVAEQAIGMQSFV